MCEEGSVKICTTFSWLCASLMEQLKIFSKTISRTPNKDYVYKVATNFIVADL